MPAESVLMLTGASSPPPHAHSTRTGNSAAPGREVIVADMIAFGDGWSGGRLGGSIRVGRRARKGGCPRARSVHRPPREMVRRKVRARTPGGGTMANKRDTTVIKVDSTHSPEAPGGMRYLASGTSLAMRMWVDEQPGEKAGKS